MHIQSVPKLEDLAFEVSYQEALSNLSTWFEHRPEGKRLLWLYTTVQIWNSIHLLRVRKCAALWSVGSATTFLAQWVTLSGGFHTLYSYYYTYITHPTFNWFLGVNIPNYFMKVFWDIKKRVVTLLISGSFWTASWMSTLRSWKFMLPSLIPSQVSSLFLQSQSILLCSRNCQSISNWWRKLMNKRKRSSWDNSSSL